MPTFAHHSAALAAAAFLVLAAVPAAASTPAAPVPCRIPDAAAATPAPHAQPRAVSGDGGIAIASAASPPEAGDADADARAREAAGFATLLAARSAVRAPVALALPLSPRQRREIAADPAPVGVPKVGSAVDVGATVAFAGIDLSRLPDGGAAVRQGQLGRTPDGRFVWEAALASDGAEALRVEFADLDLAPGAVLYVYNEDGQVWGPYAGRGPDGSGGFWSPSTFGDVVRIHLRADDPVALAASRFTLARLMHLGPRVRAVQEAVRERYRIGPVPADVGFCGVQVPDCTRDASCHLGAYAGLPDAADAIAHLQYVKDGSAYICTGAYLAQSGNAPQQPYFMTANHCFSTQASASSLEAYFKFRSSACNGTCPVRTGVPRVNGATLIASGALPNAADYTFVRLSGFPAGGARLLGWTSATVPEASILVHMGHPGGAPLSYSFRRARLNNASLPHAPDWPEPTFLYSGLASSSADWIGATAGGSSGGPALLVQSGGAVFVGQLLGAVAPQGQLDRCDPNATSTVDGALRSSFPGVRRYLYDRLFASGFERP